MDRAAALTAADLLTYEELQPELIGRLVQQKSLPVLLLDLSSIARVRRDKGESTYARLLDLIGKEILRLRGDYLRTDDLIALGGADGQEILVFPTPRDGGKHPRPGDLQAIGERVEVALRERVLKLSSLHGYSRLSVGVSLGILNPLVDNKSTVRRAIEDARMNAHVNELCRKVENRSRLQYLILEKAINVHFQPIVDLDFGEIHGFEALSRGPRNTDIESPLSLFGLAEENDLIYELDHVCRWKAVQSSGELESRFKLFLNTLPLSVRDPHFKGKHLQDLFNESSIVPGQVVLEVTEQFAIEDYTLYLDEMRYYSDMGCLIAIDDVGSGYSGLEKLMNIRPDYLKMDMHIVRDIDRNTMKQKIMKAFCQMAEEMGATVVAEGIETPDELLCLRELGVKYGQGYLLGKPRPEFQSRSIFDWGSLSSLAAGESVG